MDQDLLVKAGHAIVRALDNTPIAPAAALWVHSSDVDAWKLWITPRDDSVDKMRFYRVVAETIANAREDMHGVDISSIEMVKRDNPAIKGISRFMGMPGLGSAFMSDNQFNGFYLQDGILLRMEL